jgi:hypothetical protein
MKKSRVSLKRKQTSLESDYLLTKLENQTENETRTEVEFGTFSKPESAASLRTHATTLSRAMAQQPGHSVNILQQLQRDYGNQYVQRVLSQARDLKSNEGAQVQSFKRPSPTQTGLVHREKKDEGEQQAEVEGSLPDMEEEEKGVEKGPPEESLKSDGSAGSSTAATSSGASTGTSEGLKLNVDSLNLDITNSATEISDNTNKETGHSDTVSAGTVGTTFSNPGGLRVDPFGMESFRPTYTGMSWKASDPKTLKPGETPQVKLNFTLQIKCPWGTNSGGSIDVPSATAPIVSIKPHASGKKVYEQMVEDLTPVKKEKSWVAPRNYYWSKATCERHEKYHSTDDKQWSEGPGKKIVTDYLNKQTVTPKTMKTEIKQHMEDAITAMKNANFDFYTGGAATYYSYAGEERAFGDGKDVYVQLANDIKAQGQKLEKEEAEKAKKKGS